MTDSPFRGLYLPPENTCQYLERIGVSYKEDASLSYLSELMLGQLHHIPFEDLDVFHGQKEPDLTTKGLFKKIIINRRGGYCFELNGLFKKLLDALQFSCSSHMARVVWHYEHLTPPSHQVTIVTIGGQDYFCDVGFGGPIPFSPLPVVFEKDLVCPVSGRIYRFAKKDSQITLSVQTEDRFKPMLMILEHPCDPVDFVPLNHFCAHSPIEPFIHKQMVWLAAPAGRRSIEKNILRIENNGSVTEEILQTEEDLRQALKRWFGIEYPANFRDWH